MGIVCGGEKEHGRGEGLALKGGGGGLSGVTDSRIGVVSGRGRWDQGGGRKKMIIIIVKTGLEELQDREPPGLRGGAFTIACL